MKSELADILIIGAGPASSVAAAMLAQQGRQVLVIEKNEFPRFAIGECLSPGSMQVLEDAGMLRDVVEAGFHHRNGVVFAGRGARSAFDFRDKTSDGWGTSFHVQRGEFDDVLADCAERAGAEIRFCHEVVAADFSSRRPRLMIREPDGDNYAIVADFVLDGSGSAQVLPRLLGFQGPAPEAALSCALVAHLSASGFEAGMDADKTWILRHPTRDDIWAWWAPLSQGRCSIGLVAPETVVSTTPGSAADRLQALAAPLPMLGALRLNASTDGVRCLSLSAPIPQQWVGSGYAVLGNAADTLDPVFCSGTSIALHSARRAAECLAREAAGEAIDWSFDYAREIGAGLATQRAYVESWQCGQFQSLVCAERAGHGPRPLLSGQPQLRRMLSAVLAGYLWDDTNPLVRDPRRQLAVLQHHAMGGIQQAAA